jgi:hypothetical protein
MLEFSVMPPSPNDANLQSCPNCAALVDMREQEPLSRIHCPICGTSMRVSRQFNQFSIMETLGSGGMGAVYKALDRNLNRMVALKLLRRELSADESYILKLEDEARITASINHPYVVKVFSFDHDHDQYYIAMELVDKGSMDDLMQLQTRVSELQVLQVGLQVASGLQAAHELGLIHRDVKPGNILFADAQTAKITDFGLALLAEHEAESRGEIWGTPYYIAPEKLNNEPEDFRSDIYSLGGTLFHAVAGRPPFEAESASLVALKHLKSRAVSLQAFAPDVSSETAYVINRMLHKDPAQRYASYGELIDHLKYAADTVAAQAAKPRVAKQRVVLESAQQSNLAGLMTLALLVLLVAGGILAYLLRDRLFGPDLPKPVSVNPAAATTADKAVAVNALYADARHQLASQQLSNAQESFASLAQRPDLVPPLLQWVRLHQGMIVLLNHQLSESRDIFRGLQTAGPFSAKEADSKLATFFVETGRYLADTAKIPASATKIWDKNTFEALSLLLFGIKDWELGHFDDANKLFQAFLAGRPEGAYRWIMDYAPIARQCTHDYEIYAPLRDKLKGVSSDPAARTALQEQFAKMRGQLQTTGKIVEAFFLAEAELKSGAPIGAASPAASVSVSPALKPTPSPSPGLASAAASAAAAVDPLHDQETRRWQAARDSYQQMVKLYRFDEANAVIQQASLKDPDYVRARDLTRTRAQRLVAFKKTLMGDLNARGYPQPVTTRRNASYPNGIRKATSDNFEAATPYGTIAIPWLDITPKTLFTIANYFADITADPKQAANRRWLAANFAIESGLVVEGRALATRVAKERPEFAPELPQFLAPAASPPK